MVSLMGFIQDTKSATVAQDAAKAFQAGSRYFTPLLNLPATRPGFSGGIPDWSAMLDAIEAQGWQLHQWAVAPDKHGRPQAMPLFVRR